MAQKKPYGKPEAIGGAISKPNLVGPYTQDMGSMSKTKDASVEEGIANTALPKPKCTGENPTVR